MPFNNINQRIEWSILEFLGFWLILYLTRLRKPISHTNDGFGTNSHSKTNSKLFIKRTLSSKERKKQLKQFKIQQLEKRKKEFQERQRKLSTNSQRKINIMNNTNSINNNSFNTIFIKQVAKYQKEKKLKQTLMKEIQLKRPKKSPIHIQSSPKNNYNNISQTPYTNHTLNAPKHFRKMKSDGVLHMTLELDPSKEHHKTDIELTESNIAMDISEKQPFNLKINKNKPEMEDIEVDIDNITPIPTGINISHDIPNINISTTPMISISPSQQYTLTPRHNFRNHHVSVVITPATHLKSSPFEFYPNTNTNTHESISSPDTSGNLSSDWENNNNNDSSNGIGLKTIIAKIGSVFTPHPSTFSNNNHNSDSDSNNKNNTNIELKTFPKVRILSNNDDDNSQASGFNLQFDTPGQTPHTAGTVSHINEIKMDLSIIDGNDESKDEIIAVHVTENKNNSNNASMDGIIDMYMDAFNKTNDDDESDSIEIKKDEIDEIPIPNTNIDAPIPKMNILEKQSSGDFTNLIGDGLFHNIHLKPTLLKRSHSDPDIRVRDKIWDQLLMAFKQSSKNKNINNNYNSQLPTDGTMLGNYVSDITQELTKYNQQRKDSKAGSDTARDDSRRLSKFSDYCITQMDNENENEINENEISHVTQLSINENDKQFNIFGWFDHINNDNKNETDMEIVNELKVTKSFDSKNEIKTKGSHDRKIQRRNTQKPSSSKIWRNLVKKKAHHVIAGHGHGHGHGHGRKDSLEIPTSDLPMDMIYQTNKPQKMSVRISDEKNITNKLQIDMKINDDNNDKFNSSTTQLKSEETNQNNRLKTKRKLKSRIRRKKQTKQWINNVHQVF